ncbi:MAG: NADH-quinone oxidoreductase subunit C, partial [Methylobacteriaceae bacterium]|nr:NADH-quinone oxidoreductase subunit C [Methylobacteriaceae bacterium]
MTSLGEVLAEGRRIEAHRPRPRIEVDAEAWAAIAGLLAGGRGTLMSLWSDGEAVHMAVLEDGRAEVELVSLAVPARRFPSVARLHAPALRLERTVRDLYGIDAEGAPDARAWLDHRRWGVRAPLGAAGPEPAEGSPYAFLEAVGAPLHQIPVGPVHAGIIEPGHFRFSASGETVVRLEERLGYVHKGIDGLLAGAPLDRATRLAGRVSGDSTVAYSLAFCRAVEAALAIEVPPRAVLLRALMAELERIANHFGDIGAICNDASFSLMHAHTGVLRERMLR